MNDILYEKSNHRSCTCHIQENTYTYIQKILSQPAMKIIRLNQEIWSAYNKSQEFGWYT